MFSAVLINKTDDHYQAALTRLDEDRLPAGEVTVRVEWSTLNYKDGLAITGRSPIVRSFPMVAGIDLAGIVERSDDGGFAPGDAVVVNGRGMSEHRWGGLAGKARLRTEDVLKLPAVFTTRQAMAIGTAGFTAMLCVLALERYGVRPDQGEILVDGASGGVGSVAVALLAKLGFRVAAVTGRPDHVDYIRHLGAAEVLDRSLFAGPARPLAKERWAGAIDVAGGNTLAHICSAMKYGGVVAACGMADSLNLPTSVAPFILRAVTLAGVESAMCPRGLRQTAWQRLATDLDPDLLDVMTSEISLADAIPTASRLLDGKLKGRVVVNMASCAPNRQIRRDN